MKRKRLSMILTVFSMGVLILDSRNTMRYAAEGIQLCIQAVIPSLFPFFVRSIFLTGNLSPKNTVASVILAGFLGGYPVGAQAAAESVRNGRFSREQGNRLLLFCSQAGPAFLFGMVAPQFPERKYVWFLWAVQILSGASVAALTPGVDSHMRIPEDQPGISLPEAMKSAVRAIASVCGWVVLFRVILGYLCRIPLDGNWKILLSGLTELTNGCLQLEDVENPDFRFLLAAVMLNWGGICVFLQTASVARGLNLKYYLLGKLLQTGFSLLYSLGFLGFWQALIPIFGVIYLFRRRIPVKRSSIPAEVGV